VAFSDYAPPDYADAVVVYLKGIMGSEVPGEFEDEPCQQAGNKLPPAPGM